MRRVNDLLGEWCLVFGGLVVWCLVALVLGKWCCLMTGA